MPEASFFEKFPLYRKYMVPIPGTLDNVHKPNINMHCNVCKSTRTFVMTNEYYSGKQYTNYPSKGASFTSEYTCVSCRKFHRSFMMRVSEDLDYIQKTGQFPPWDIAVDADVEHMLEGHADLMRRGLILESQGYGIGAFGYYRRIVEEIIDTLLDDIEILIPENEKEIYRDALQKTKSTRQTSEKIDLVKDLLPTILRPNGMNPLSLLHSVLSEGLHAETDDRCLELSSEARQILTFLASQIVTTTRSSQAFTDSMKSLLEKRGSKQ